MFERKRRESKTSRKRKKEVRNLQDCILMEKKGTDQNKSENKATESSGNETTNPLYTLLTEKGFEALMSYWTKENETEKLNHEYNLKDLEVINRLDRRDKIFKGVLLDICLIGLVVLSIMEKAVSVAPVLGVIIGLLLKTSSITEYKSGSNNRNDNSNENI